MTYASMRFSRDNATAKDAVNGYDYRHHAWVLDGKYVECGHGKPCNCYGTIHHGEPVAKDADVH